METALILPIPEADPIVSRWRLAHDRSAAQGVPAHVTVLYPFKPYDEIDAACRETLAQILRACGELEVHFERLARFPDTLWLAPEPDEPIRQLTHAVVERFPDYPHYGGAFETVVPHLTIAQGEAAALERIEGEVREAMRGAIHSRACECALFAHAPDRWHEMERFSLRA